MLVAFILSQSSQMWLRHIEVVKVDEDSYLYSWI